MTFSLKGMTSSGTPYWVSVLKDRHGPGFTARAKERRIWTRRDHAAAHLLMLCNTASELQRSTIYRLEVDDEGPQVEPVFSALRADELIAVPRGDLFGLYQEAKGRRNGTRPELLRRIAALLEEKSP